MNSEHAILAKYHLAQLGKLIDDMLQLRIVNDNELLKKLAASEAQVKKLERDIELLTNQIWERIQESATQDDDVQRHKG